MQNNKAKDFQEDSQYKYIFTFPNSFTAGVLHQDLINAKVSYYGGMFTKDLPKNWLENKNGFY